MARHSVMLDLYWCHRNRRQATKPSVQKTKAKIKEMTVNTREVIKLRILLPFLFH